MSTLDSLLANLVPYPKSEEEATADAMGAHFTAKAALWGRIALDHPDRDQRGEAHRKVGDYYCRAFLLREMESNAFAGHILADESARGLYRTLDDGEAMAADLDEWLGYYDIDPEQIAEIAKQVCTPNPLAGTQAGTETAA